MACKHCFATYDDIQTRLNLQHALATIQELSRHFKKITFVGGEPTLCPWLLDCLELALSQGLETSVVTNGRRLLDEPAFCTQALPLIHTLGISVDSLNSQTCLEMGRSLSSGRTLNANDLSTLENWRNTLRKVVLSETQRSRRETALGHCVSRFGKGCRQGE